MKKLYLWIIFVITNFSVHPQIVDSLDLDFSHSRGFYDNPFNLIVSSNDQIDSLYYTIDFTDPSTSESSYSSVLPAKIIIDPNSENNLYTSPSIIIRFVGYKSNQIVTKIITQTYIFTNEIENLSPDGIKPGDGWPNPKSSGSGQFIDYGFDPQVIKDTRYIDKIEEAILSIPSISIVTDLNNLFNSSSGIYVNAREDGQEWERPASIEFLNFDAGDFQVNAGIRMRGGFSRRDSNPKHSFRILFKSEYGDAKLYYPLFGDDGEKSFDNLDLRTNQNYGWHSSQNNQAEKNTMVREVFARDAQRDFGEPYTRSNQIHLFLNGVYWGLYMTQERSESDYAKSYFDGNEEDFDVIKTNKENQNRMEATDGNLDAWKRLWTASLNGFDSNSEYFNIQGKDDSGLNDPQFERLLDVDNLIKYLLIIYYTGNFDAPVGWWWNNQKPNNVWTIYNRMNPDGFKFFQHDCEHIFVDDPSADFHDLGLNLDRTGPWPQTGEWYWFNAQELHQSLIENEEYYIRFIDLVYNAYFKDGILTPNKNTLRFKTRLNEIEDAIIAESARWGDAHEERKNNPRTKDDDWVKAKDDIIQNYFPYRTDIVIEQLRDNDWSPSFSPPQFSIGREEVNVHSKDISSGTSISVKNINGNPNAQIVITFDGSDPRQIGGNVNPNAIVLNQDFEFTLDTTTTVLARLKISDSWSALNKVNFDIYNAASEIIFSEIHYHPLEEGDIDDDNYEFLEIKNVGSFQYDLSNAYFDNGFSYMFSSGTIIQPGEFIVLASNSSRFSERYGFEPFGVFAGKLDNGGETISLVDADSNKIISVKYDDEAPWPIDADGYGNSLTNVYSEKTSDPDNYNNWVISSSLHGSPGTDDISTAIDETDNTISEEFTLGQNYPNPFNPFTNISYIVPSKPFKNSEKTKTTFVELIVFDALGREVTTLVNMNQIPGQYSVRFDASNLSSGIYFYQLRFGDLIETKKMILLK